MRWGFSPNDSGHETARGVPSIICREGRRLYTEVVTESEVDVAGEG